MYNLNICYLYPELTNSYGDIGNVFVLKKRCQWRDIVVNIHNISIDDEFIPEDYDMVFFGSSQDHEKKIILEDFKSSKLDSVKQAIDNDVVFLCIGGGYQLMGKKIITSPGAELACANILDIITVDFEKRLSGYLIFQCEFLPETKVVGFENHGEKTWLGPSVKPLGKVLHGYGNNGEDGYEGAIYRNVYCSYAHGSLLPRNPKLADHLITLAMKRKYPDFTELQALDDELEDIARHTIVAQYLK